MIMIKLSLVSILRIKPPFSVMFKMIVCNLLWIRVLSIESRKTINALEQAIMEGDNPVVSGFY